MAKIKKLIITFSISFLAVCLAIYVNFEAFLEYRNFYRTNFLNLNASVPAIVAGIRIFRESRMAHEYLDNRSGVEIGASTHNPFGLNTINVNFSPNETQWKTEEKALTGRNSRVDIIASGDQLPFPDNSQDFVINSHVIEHFYDPIKAIKEWLRVVRPNGYVFMIVPHKERTYDKNKPRTTLAELIERHEHPDPPASNDYWCGNNCHYSVWITQDFLELCLHYKWKVVGVQDVDDKVGNGFTVVLQKE